MQEKEEKFHLSIISEQDIKRKKTTFSNDAIKIFFIYKFLLSFSFTSTGAN